VGAAHRQFLSEYQTLGAKAIAADDIQVRRLSGLANEMTGTLASKTEGLIVVRT
jgi:hypothetical protein